MNIKTKNYLSVIFKVVCIVLGCFVMGCAYNLFYAPNQIVLGGFGGLSMLISYWLLGVGVSFDMSIIYFALNIVVFVFACKLLGKSFALYTILGISCYTLFLKATTFVSALNIPTDDLLLCCLYGGVITGVGIGLVVRVGGSTGGGDLLGCIANRISRRFTVGNVSTAINFVVIMLSIFTYGMELSLYGIIAIYISGVVTDVVVEGPKSVKAYYIISKKYVEISNSIMSDLGRGVTALYGEGMWTGNDQRVLLCIVYKHQINKLKNIIYGIDDKAFVYSVSVNDAMGKGFANLKPSQNLLQRIALKSANKAIPNKTEIQQSVYTTMPTSDGIDIFKDGLKADINKIKDVGCVGVVGKNSKEKSEKRNKKSNDNKN